MTSTYTGLCVNTSAQGGKRDKSWHFRIGVRNGQRDISWHFRTRGSNQHAEGLDDFGGGRNWIFGFIMIPLL